jgi:hypothetical protein
MTIYLTIFSIISHFIQFGAQLIIFVFSSKITTILYGWIRFAFLFIIIFKNLLTIFFYYFFNSNFKNTTGVFHIFQKKTLMNVYERYMPFFLFIFLFNLY